MREFPVPDEMKPYPNWIVWGKEQNKSDKQPWSPVKNTGASPVNPKDWGNYTQACEFANAHNFAGVGFVLSGKDPFAFIDLDDPQGDPTMCDHQQAIFKAFPSYAERSPSGRGLHIIVKGEVPRGRRRNRVEVYSAARYMTMTGDVYRNLPIVSCQEELIKLYQKLGGCEKAVSMLDDTHDEIEDDETVLHRASTAANAEKFNDLWRGDWEKYYPNSEGPSEADFALIDILAFYTQSKTQIVRLFHQSALGKRSKAKRRDYLEYMLNKCFDRILPPVDLGYLKQEIDLKIAEYNLQLENPELKPKKSNSIYNPPPGLLGEIAQYIYEQSTHPVREIALIAAMGLMSGIVGRSYNVSDTGLNLYYLLLADTGVGKEAIAKGIGRIVTEARKICPSIEDFRGPREIASPQALVKHLNDGNNSFVSIIGEFAHMMKNMTAKNAPSYMVGLKGLILELYSKSGEGNVLGSTVYSDRGKNTKPIVAPAVTLLGECTPGKFYELLDESMVEDGFLPRFLTIEYMGDRVPFNYQHMNAILPVELIDKVASLCTHSNSLNATDTVIHVKFDESSNQVLYDFEAFCTQQINKTKVQVRRQLWNRAHLKVLKLSALVAIGINPIDPVIDLNCVTWAKALVEQDCFNIIERFEAGDVGETAEESSQIKLVSDSIVKFTICNFGDLSKSGRGVKNINLYHAERCVPYSWIQKTLVGRKQFKNDRRGPTKAIKETIKTLIDTGDISELPVPERKSKFGAVTACYIIENEKLLTDANRKRVL